MNNEKHIKSNLSRARKGPNKAPRQSSEAEREVMEIGCLMQDTRPLRRAMERDLVDPLLRLIASQKIPAGDIVEVELEKGNLKFFRGSRLSETLIA